MHRLNRHRARSKPVHFAKAPCTQWRFKSWRQTTAHNQSFRPHVNLIERFRP